MTVYLVQEVRGRDFSKAKNYGDVEVLVPTFEQATISTESMVRRMVRRLSEFADGDYLLLSGDPVAIAVAVALAAHHNKGRVKVLKWDRLTEDYFPLQIDITPERV